MKIEIRHRFNSSILFSFECSMVKECVVEAVKQQAYLSVANLRGANLHEATLSGAKDYKNSHHFFFECVSRLDITLVTNLEWSMVGILSTHSPCWGTIKKRWGKKIMPLFKKLSKAGFDEWEKHYAEVLKVKGGER